MIGLLDLDWHRSTSTTLLIPNLEIMKLANFYKTENQFCHLMSLDEQDFSHYETIYCFSETAKDTTLPNAFLRAPQLIYGGTNFTNQVYIPFENSVIDFTLPRTAIYKEALKQKYNDGIKTKVISHALDDTYYRMYAGNERLPIPVVLPNKRVFIYDRDFFYPDWEDIIKEISNRRPASINCIHPIKCDTLSQYFALRNYSKVARSNAIILDVNVPPEEIPYLLKNYKNLFLADIVPNSNVYIPFGGSYKTRYLYYKDLIYKLNLLYSFWSCGIMIKMRYEQPLIGFSNPISHLSELIAVWSNIRNEKKTKTSILDRIPKKKKENYIKEEYELFIKMNPTTKDLFTQTFDDVRKRGQWRT